MIAPGEAAPEFSGTTHEGRTITLSELKGHPLVLYFYPKAGSSGCSLEAKQFEQHLPEFRAHGAQIVGVSIDTVEAQQSFASDCHLAYPLIADVDRSIAKSYGVLGSFGKARRVTFLIGPDGTVLERIEGLLPGPHVRRAVARFGSPKG